MAKEKLKLSDLKVQSFVTALDGERLEEVKGGLRQFAVNGTKSNYKIRWTSLDTRLDPEGHVKSSSGTNQ